MKTISFSTLVGKRKLSVWERIQLWLDGKEIMPVNEHKCPSCECWDHEYPAENTWRDAVSPRPQFGYYDEIKTCGNCGYESRWFDTGFMGVMGCLDAVQPESRAFDHALKKDRRC